MHAILVAGAVVYLFVSTLPNENALALAAEGKLQLSAVWGYRFRSADFLNMIGQPTLLMALLKICGVKAFWCATILLQTLLLAAERRTLRGFFICLTAASIVFAPALVFWSAALAGVIVALRRLRQIFRPTADRSSANFLLFGGAIMATSGAIYTALWLANPMHHVHRQRVLGGKSFRDGIISVETGQKLQIGEACLAVINPDDLRGISSLESLSLPSLRKLPSLALIDLKVVESNYRLLTLRDEKGVFVFTAEARAFASAEKQYAEKLMTQILTAPRVCLIANFETSPIAETPPYSRAREIYERRKKAGLDSLVIRLANPK